MNEFKYDYEKKRNMVKRKLCYMDTDSFLVYIKTNDVYKDIAEGVGTRFDTSHYDLDKLLLKRKTKRLIGLMKAELGGKIMINFVGLRPKTYSYLIDDASEDRKVKVTKQFFIKKT